MSPHALAAVKTMPDVSVAHSLLQMVIALVVVIACIWGLSKVLARLRSGGGGGVPRRKAAPRRPAGEPLSVVSRQSLGKDLAIATVRWGDREVLVGISGSTITFLNDAQPGSGLPGAPASAAAASFPACGAWAEASSAAPSPLPTTSFLALPAGGTERPRSLIEALREATLRR